MMMGGPAPLRQRPHHGTSPTPAHSLDGAASRSWLSPAAYGHSTARSAPAPAPGHAPGHGQGSPLAQLLSQRELRAQGQGAGTEHGPVMQRPPPLRSPQQQQQQAGGPWQGPGWAVGGLGKRRAQEWQVEEQGVDDEEEAQCAGGGAGGAGDGAALPPPVLHSLHHEQPVVVPGMQPAAAPATAAACAPPSLSHLLCDQPPKPTMRAVQPRLSYSHLRSAHAPGAGVRGSASGALHGGSPCPCPAPGPGLGLGLAPAAYSVDEPPESPQGLGPGGAAALPSPDYDYGDDCSNMDDELMGGHRVDDDHDPQASWRGDGSSGHLSDHAAADAAADARGSVAARSVLPAATAVWPWPRSAAAVPTQPVLCAQLQPQPQPQVRSLYICEQPSAAKRQCRSSPSARWPVRMPLVCDLADWEDWDDMDVDGEACRGSAAALAWASVCGWRMLWRCQACAHALT